MAAGGGTAVTIGPPSTTGEATALVACVVAMAVAEVDAVIGITDGGTAAVVNVADVDVTVDGESNAAADVDVIGAAVVDVVAVTVAIAVTAFTPLSGVGWWTSFGGISGLDRAAAVDCFLGKRGDDLTGGRMAVGLLPTIASVDGCGRLGVFGDLSGSGDLGGTGLRGVDGIFLRGDDLTTVGTVGGLAITAIGAAGGLAVTAGVFREPTAPPGADGCFVDPDVR